MPLSKEEFAQKRAEFLGENARLVALHRADPPSKHKDHMLDFDALEKPWRDLANEFGIEPVVMLLREERSLNYARFNLRDVRAHRQKKLLEAEYKPRDLVAEAVGRAMIGKGAAA